MEVKQNNLPNMIESATGIAQLAKRTKSFCEKLVEKMKPFIGKNILNNDGQYHKRFIDMVKSVHNEEEQKETEKQKFSFYLKKRNYFQERMEIIVECIHDYKEFRTHYNGEICLYSDGSPWLMTSKHSISPCIGLMNNGILTEITPPDIKIPEWENDIQKHAQEGLANIEAYIKRKQEVENELKELERKIPHYFQS